MGHRIGHVGHWLRIIHAPGRPQIIFEGRNWPQQTIYHWKGNVMAIRIHFKYWKNILISRLYEQFSRNDSAMAAEWLSEKFNLLYIVLKHVIWRFRICNYFCKISKFRDFMNTLRNFTKSVFVHIFVKFKYFFGKQFILTESPDHVL